MATEKPARRTLLNRYAARFSNSPVPFEVILPDGTAQRFGQGAPAFHLSLTNDRAVRAIVSLDEGRFGDAYVAGDLDIEDDRLRPFELRKALKDVHPLTTAWRFIQPLLFGQVHTNQRAITAHDDLKPEFFLSFLDPKTPCYTQGVFDDSDETLDVATLRKFAYCYEKCRLKPGDHILEVGPGWGTRFKYSSRRGVHCTGIIISQISIDNLNRRARELGFDWELVLSDLLEYKTDRKYDAIVIMGVTEH